MSYSTDIQIDLCFLQWKLHTWSSSQGLSIKKRVASAPKQLEFGVLGPLGYFTSQLTLAFIQERKQLSYQIVEEKIRFVGKLKIIQPFSISFPMKMQTYGFPKLLKYQASPTYLCSRGQQFYSNLE